GFEGKFHKNNLNLSYSISTGTIPFYYSIDCKLKGKELHVKYSLSKTNIIIYSILGLLFCLGFLINPIEEFNYVIFNYLFSLIPPIITYLLVVLSFYTCLDKCKNEFQKFIAP
ncbi:MAG: hypothetical protein KDD41_02555, partial [Flavobacteriales bacterium]|nr:hypothetical protein [Flavobacteriales bacterium]